MAVIVEELGETEVTNATQWTLAGILGGSRDRYNLSKTRPPFNHISTTILRGNYQVTKYDLPLQYAPNGRNQEGKWCVAMCLMRGDI